ncbi:MAG: ERCC4 domain-containing protein [Candidatus Pacearchaeota archaeon]
MLDIFKKDKGKSKEKLRIIVDFREKNSLVVAELVSKGILLELKNLCVGDYIVNDVIIERKTYNDFINSIINKRLIEQLENLEKCEKKLLIIEGCKEEISERKINQNAINGFLLSVLINRKIPILFTEDYEETSNFLYILAKKKKRKNFSLRFKNKNMNRKELLQFILEGFPTIGPITAKRLLKNFKTIKNVINANEEELRKILGKKTDLFLKIINSEY